MKTLFLGLGKVNKSLASQIKGERLALVEDEGFVDVSKASSGDSDFQKVDRIRGTFDDIDWNDYLPARVFISPGIDPRRPFFRFVKDFEERELSFFCENYHGKIVVITGTDGKSTFTTQLGEVLRRALPEVSVFVGGNLGTAMSDALGGDSKIAVLEVSSFQAERLKTARIDLAVLINLSTDHLDRYDSLKDYHQAKWGLLMIASKLAYPSDLVPPATISKSICDYKNEDSIPTILKSVVRAIAPNFEFEFREELLEKLPVLRHRLEYWISPRGFSFINDSKATTVHAVAYGLRETQKKFEKVRLILGGRYKGDDFSLLKPLLRAADEVLICGEAREIISKQLHHPAEIFENLKGCLSSIRLETDLKSVILLSPGCSSYDEFNHFEERGDFFLKEVQRLAWADA